MFSTIEMAISSQTQKCDIPSLGSDVITQLRVGGGEEFGKGRFFGNKGVNFISNNQINRLEIMKFIFTALAILSEFD